MTRGSIMSRVHPTYSVKRSEDSGDLLPPSAAEQKVDGDEGIKPQPKVQVKPKKRKAMLTSAQLSDLFTRLDKNGDGVLDLDEFIGLIRLLKIDVSEDLAASVFRQIDQGAGNSELTGTLDMQEFIAAYQKLYIGMKNGDSGEMHGRNRSFVRATRYGRMLNGEYVFECYTIPSSGTGEKYTLDLSVSEPDTSDDESEVEPKIVPEQPPKNLWDATSEIWEGTVEDIIALIRQDSSRNKTLHSNVLWWIDAAYDAVDRSTAEDIITRFGLPNDSKFLSNFGNFGSGMPADSKSRLFAGTGNHTSGNMCSLSYFAQAMWIKDMPVVHHLPPWFGAGLFNSCFKPGGFISSFSNALFEYYKTRFAWLLNISWINTSEDERRAAYQRAEGLATLIKTSDDVDEEEFQSVPSTLVRPGSAGDTIFTSKGSGVPLSQNQRTGYADTPTWLQSTAHLHKHPAHVHMDSMSFHLLDQGFGAHTLLTVRQMDAEGQKRFTAEQQSRAGVLGRIVSGVWVKLAQTTIKGRRAGAAGELTDSPASLVTFLLMLMHNFSMNSSASLDYWLNILEAEIRDIVVSKHGAHLVDIERIIKDFNSYLDPLEGIIQGLVEEQESLQRLEGEGNVIIQIVPDLKPLMTPRSKPKRRSLMAFDASMNPALPEGAEKTSLSFSLIHRFLGGDPYRELRAMQEGYELLDIRGLLYWKERLKKYSVKVESLKLLIKTQLDEKRNFISFMLTAITTVLAPLTIFTGYFGMNFENMVELNADTYPSIPGVVILWVICGVAYGALLLIGVHFRILYSVS